MTEDKKRAPRRLPFGDELELYIRKAPAQELIDLQCRVAREVRMREMEAKQAENQPGPHLGKAIEVPVQVGVEQKQKQAEVKS